MENDDNVSHVQTQLDVLMQLHGEATSLHVSLMEIIPEVEKEKQRVWFASVNKYNKGFIEDVNSWLSETKRPASRHATSDNVERQPSNKECENPSTLPLHEQHLDSNMSPDMGQEEMPGKGHDMDQDDIRPNDSISNVGRKYGSKTGTSRTSSSSVSSSHVKAEAEMAALLTRQKLLKQKQELDQQEEEIRKRKERFELEVEIAAAQARMEVLKVSGSSVKGSRCKKSDGMESYMARGAYALDAEADSFVPGGQGVYDSRISSKSQSSKANERKITVDAGSQIVQQRLPGFRVAPNGNNDVSASQFSVSPHAQVPVADNSNNLLSLMARQTEISALLVQQHNISHLPKREIQMFDGDPLHYHAFIRAFVRNVEERTGDAGDCLHFLAQYTRGEPRELVRSCQQMPAVRGYRKAKALLEEHFGNEQRIASAYLDKALSWPVVKAEDAKSLQAYGLFLRGCCNVMDDIQYMSELNMPANMLTVIKKLPYKLRDRWRSAACGIQETSHRRATFPDIVSFIERQVKIVADPVFGNIQDTLKTTQIKDSSKGNYQRRTRNQGSSFATTVTSVDEKAHVKREGAPLDKRTCLYCKGEHALELCSLLEKSAHKEKITFLKEHGVCFGCLCIGHMSKDCRRRLSCKTCGARHPSILHIHTKNKDHDKNQVGVADTNSRNSGLTGAGDHDCKLSIVPVKVKSKKGRKIVETYAFLDQGSSGSFCTSSLMNKLNVSGRGTKILLRTMGQEKLVGCCIVSDLEVAGLESDLYCDLPDIFTQKKMPVCRNNIAREQDLVRWPYLRGVHLPEIDADIELLIGLNAPRALEPIKVIPSEEGGPYAVQTVLGWTVNGPMSGAADLEHLTITANRISVVKLDELWKQQFQLDFRECRHEEQLGPSREDCQFMEMVKGTVQVVDGHYTIGLPLKRRDVCMPDNRKLAEQRALSLKRRFQKDATFHSDYTIFMHNIISCGYAEKIPADELAYSRGKIWYIPHHGVYHPQKKKIRVVFDCAASFQGMSLNTQLLQGPDLTSSLI
ncbi:hypothetical protein N1851_012226 [Merluccius polli]|uniref:CCHC-type domain-containing protein n=1 Tax=Merluccius polli TaxID=89951 RepID=A0AA47MXG3_MERPO|nr:hypothetical protein N1851_012226 [Merluccius polli]